MAISQVGGANNNSAVGVSALTVTYTPSNGNHVIVFVNTGGGVTNLTVADNNAVALTAGAVQGNHACFAYKVTGSPTSFVATWTGSQQVGMAIEEYSGAAGFDARLTLKASGNSGTDTITITMLQSNNWIVCGLGSANTITGTVGNQRQQVTASTGRVTLMDNTSGTTSATCTGTLTSAAWTAVGIELGGAGAERIDQDLTLVAKQPTSSLAHVDQAIILAARQATSSTAHVDQDITLAARQPTDTHIRVNQDVILVAFKIVRKPGTIVFVVT